jgi:hypothetical protein
LLSSPSTPGAVAPAPPAAAGRVAGRTGMALVEGTAGPGESAGPVGTVAAAGPLAAIDGTASPLALLELPELVEPQLDRITATATISAAAPPAER